MRAILSLRGVSLHHIFNCNTLYSQKFDLKKRARKELDNHPTKRDFDEMAANMAREKREEKKRKIEKRCNEIDLKVLQKLLEDHQIEFKGRVTKEKLLLLAPKVGIEHLKKSQKLSELVEIFRPKIDQKLFSLTSSLTFPLLPLNNED